MTAKQLKNSILQQAIQGKLINQNKEDKPASELLKRIKAEREKLIKSGKIKINKNISAIYRKGNSFYEKIENEEICIDEELPFEIPKTWEWVYFKDIVYYSMGKTPPRKEKEYWENPKFAWISIADLVSNGFIYETKEKVNQYSVDKIFKNKVSVAGTLLMSFKLTVGKVSILGIDAYHNEAIISIYPFINDENIMRDYLFFILPLISQYGNIKSAIKGNTLNSDSLDLLYIPLPPIEEQKRIVNKLNQLMPLIEEYEEKENKLNELDKKFPERLKKSILKEAFDGKLIKSYNKKTLEEICIYSTSNIAIKDIKNKKGNYPVYGASGIIGYVDFYSKEKECVAVVKDGSIGKVFLLPAKSSVISTLCYLENIEILNIKYLYYFLQSINFIKYKKGSMIPHIYFKDYKKEKVIIPPIEEQKRIVEKLDKLINACEELKKILFI
ncbi:restriction endonuclease subunit S [Brachyspira aalborgi]|uniref:restriction endonuclease subunit S n=1 Tax=Brachyspira aalborgi TaxID=29522 RepID=UPI00266C7D80|nr:restriction endonuclease subunit S [Brachyspira aalborgi]